MSIPEKLRARLQKNILLKNNESGVKLYSPVHHLYMGMTEESLLKADGFTMSTDDFTAPELFSADEKARMYRQAFLKTGPVFSSMNLELTRSCTLHCPHCFIHHKGGPRRTLFDEAVIEKLMTYAPAEISLTGGEIFLTDNLADIIRKAVAISEKHLHFRLLANGSWVYDKKGVRALLDSLAGIDASFRFRFTVFHHRPEMHDILCGSMGHLKALVETIEIMKRQDAAFSVNFPVTSVSFEKRHSTLNFLQDLTGGNFSVSSIVYPSRHAYRHAKKMSLSEEEFSLLLSEPEFRPLASAYCDPSEQCQYHCRFPLMDSAGNIYRCNLPESPVIEDDGSNSEKREKTQAICSSCEAADWCKKCPSAVPEFQDIYCPPARIAAARVRQDFETAIAEGYSPVRP